MGKVRYGFDVAVGIALISITIYSLRFCYFYLWSAVQSTSLDLDSRSSTWVMLKAFIRACIFIIRTGWMTLFVGDAQDVNTSCSWRTHAMEPLGRCCFTQHTISLRSYVEAASCTDLVLIKAKRGLSTDAIIRSVIVFKKKNTSYIIEHLCKDLLLQGNCQSY